MAQGRILVFWGGGEFPSTEFVGIDIEKRLLDLYQGTESNVRVEQGDWFNLSDKYINYFKGIVSFQTISWLSDYKDAILSLCKLNPEWIAMSGLFYPGKINFYIRMDNHESPGEPYYNIYSLPLVEKLFAKNGYTHFEYVPFEIDIDLPKPTSYRMQTYTVKTKDDKRLQISGALLMPWYFIYASK